MVEAIARPPAPMPAATARPGPPPARAEDDAADRLREAEACFRTAIALEPERASSHYHLGRVLVRQERFADAVVRFRAAIDRAPQFPGAVRQLAAAYYRQQVRDRGYDFSQDWFGHNIPILWQFAGPLAGKPGLQVLEIGSWEGRSACWWLDNVLVHPTARIDCIDTFAGSDEHRAALPAGDLRAIEARFDANLHRTGAAAKVRKRVGFSQDILPQLRAERSPEVRQGSDDFGPYDFIYVDGSHLAWDVLADGVLAWPLLKPGGWIVFDDYGWQRYDRPELNPKTGIDAFFAAYGAQLTVCHRGWQAIARKRHPAAVSRDLRPEDLPST